MSDLVYEKRVIMIELIKRDSDATNKKNKAYRALFISLPTACQLEQAKGKTYATVVLFIINVLFWSALLLMISTALTWAAMRPNFQLLY